ncbi:TolC family protein, partial [Proteus mirabilis]|uniref:TolC family protein n=1 Tax=Proteus mirabilis TaxID=584 RepID=UPI00217D071C
HANSLKYILNNSLNNAPELLEAKADIDIAVAKVNQTRAQHFPVISVTGNKLLGQYHRDKSDYDNNSFIPGLRGELNIYSFGGIENDVERNEKEQLYYQFKYSETKENVAYLQKIRHWFKDLPIAIELRNNSWYQPNFVKQMLQFMKENQFSLVIVDEPQIPTNPVPFYPYVTNPNL